MSDESEREKPRVTELTDAEIRYLRECRRQTIICAITDIITLLLVAGLVALIIAAFTARG